MNNAIITGSTGFVGSSLMKKLSENQVGLIVNEDPAAKIEDPKYFSFVDDPSKIDVLYHLAGKSFVPDSWINPSEFIKVNVNGASNVFEFCSKHNIPVVFVSSYVYGKPDYLPIDEQHQIKLPNPYAYSKFLSEEVCKMFSKQFGLRYNILRPFNIYGPKQRESFLVPTIISQISTGDKIVLKDLKPKRDLLFLDDFIDSLICASGSFKNDVFNVGVGKSYSVGEIVQICQQVFSSNLIVESEGLERTNEIPNTVASISKIKEAFGWEPKVSLEEGIKRIKSSMPEFQ